MSRYLVFAGAQYYAEGGVHDLQGAFDDLDEALALARRRLERRAPNDMDGYREWAHVYDLVEGRIVAATEGQAHDAPDRLEIGDNVTLIGYPD